MEEIENYILKIILSNKFLKLIFKVFFENRFYFIIFSKIVFKNRFER